MDGNRRILEPSEAQVAGDKRAESCRGYEEVPSSDEAEETEERTKRKDVPGSKRSPDVSELPDMLQPGVAGDPPRVDGTGGGADDQIRRDVMLGQGLQHAHLDGAQACSAGKHEGGGFGHRGPPNRRLTTGVPVSTRIGSTQSDTPRRRTHGPSRCRSPQVDEDLLGARPTASGSSRAQQRPCLRRASPIPETMCRHRLWLTSGSTSTDREVVPVTAATFVVDVRARG
jgi:hypothetical protein